MEPKTGKRIVSKRAYVKAQGKRSVLAVGAIVLWVATIVGIWLIGLFLFQAISGVSRSDSMVIAFMPYFVIIIFVTGTVTLLLALSAKSVTKTARAIDPGVPLTRANTADMPAPDTLVRASTEPLQAQQSVLLRAAAEGQETPPEQLVRASMG